MAQETRTIMCSRNGETWYIKTLISERDFLSVFDKLVDYGFKDIKSCDDTTYWAQKTHQFYLEPKDLDSFYEEVTYKGQYQPKSL